MKKIVEMEETPPAQPLVVSEPSPKKPVGLYIGLGVAILALAVGTVVVRAVFSKKQAPTQVTEEETVETIAPADENIKVSVIRSTVKDNTIVLTVSGLEGKYASVAYEISYESAGIVQGVTSKPIDVTGKNEFVRDDIYLGTCSKNDCKPHPGVKKVTLVLEFTDTAGKKSQLSKDFDI